MKYPFNDDYMVYDYTTHRYYITPKCVLDKLDIDMSKFNVTGSTNKQRAGQQILNRICNTVYNEIYKVADKFTAEYTLAKVPSARDILMEAMLSQVDYFNFNGMLELYSGVDFKKGTVMPNFDDKILCHEAKEWLTQMLPETGMPIMYMGKRLSIKPNYVGDEY